MTSNSVCAVIVTYHPRPEDLKNLSVLRSQVEGMIVVDNGSDELTVVELRKAAAELRFDLLENGDNLGLAIGLNLGAQQARAQGFEWVVFFDQDSEATPTLIHKLIHVFIGHPSRDRLAVVVPRYVDRRTGLNLPPRYNDRRESELAFAMTSGSLMPLSLLEEQGWFEEGLFIGGIDFDYSLRVRSSGYKLFECSDAVLLHSPSSPRFYRLFGFTILATSNYSAERRYYSERNRVWLRRKYMGRFPSICFGLYWSSIKEVIKIVLVEEDKARKLRCICRGIWDGWRCRMGRNNSL
jgi:rhamnosyltransferase